MASPSSSSKKIKFHYGYGGKFVFNGGKVRYAGGTNRIMTVDRRISYTELIVKLWDNCGPSMSLRCMLPPTEDFKVLVHVTSDEDLAYVIGEYDRSGKDLKIRAILDPLPPTRSEVVYHNYLGGDTVAQSCSVLPVVRCGGNSMKTNPWPEMLMVSRVRR